jgi:hypothetical protein
MKNNNGITIISKNGENITQEQRVAANLKAEGFIADLKAPGGAIDRLSAIIGKMAGDAKPSGLSIIRMQLNGKAVDVLVETQPGGAEPLAILCSDAACGQLEMPGNGADNSIDNPLLVAECPPVEYLLKHNIRMRGELPDYHCGDPDCTACGMSNESPSGLFH